MKAKAVTRARKTRVEDRNAISQETPESKLEGEFLVVYWEVKGG